MLPLRTKVAYEEQEFLRRKRLGSLASLFYAGEAGAWYDPSDLSTLFQDSAGTTPVVNDGDPVGMMRDKSGNGNHIVQATAAARPIFHTSGGKYWIEADGVDDRMAVGFTIPQPWDRVSAIRQVTWTLSDRIFGGFNVNSGALFQSTATPRLGMFSGVVHNGVTDLAVGADGVVTERHNGANSSIAVGSLAYTTADAGTVAAAGLALFCRHDTLANFGNARCYGVVMRAAMTDDQITYARAYMASKI